MLYRSQAQLPECVGSLFNLFYFFQSKNIMSRFFPISSTRGMVSKTNGLQLFLPVSARLIKHPFHDLPSLKFIRIRPLRHVRYGKIHRGAERLLIL